MIDPNALDNASIEELMDLKERVEKKLSDKIAAEKADLEKRQSSLAKTMERMAKGPARTTRRAAGAGSKRADKDASKATANDAGDEGLRSDGESAATIVDGQVTEAMTA